MKKLLIIVLSPILFGGCSKSVGTSLEKSESQADVFDYDIIKDKEILWNDLLIQEKESYSVYIYSLTCGHCNEIKQEIISYALNHDDFYIVEYNKNIPICDGQEEQGEKDKLEDICIFGTPSLLSINSGVLVKNIAGSKAILEAI